MKKIYISGCGGMLGEAFYRLFNDYELKCSDINANEIWLYPLDITDSKAYLREVTLFKPDYLFHLGAYADIEFCEKNADIAYLTNALSVETAVYIANKLDIPLVYINTSNIFGKGTKLVYDDWDIPEPVTVYARSKYAGERFIVENAKRYVICRVGWLFGGIAKDKRLVGKVMRQIQSGVKDIYASTDSWSTPTYTYDLVMVIRYLLQNELWGVYNVVCNGGAVTRYMIVEEMIKILGLEINLHGVNSDYFKCEYFGNRPQSEALSNTKLSLRRINFMRNWDICLEEYLQNIYHDS